MSGSFSTDSGVLGFSLGTGSSTLGVEGTGSPLLIGLEGRSLSPTSGTKSEELLEGFFILGVGSRVRILVGGSGIRVSHSGKVSTLWESRGQDHFCVRVEGRLLSPTMGTGLGPL